MEYVEFAIKYWYLFVALVVVLALLVMGPIVQLMHGIKNVNVWTAVKLINHESAIIIDVSEQPEFKTGHIPNSINIPLGNLPGRIKELEKHKGKPIVISCRTGNRSSRGAVILRKHGFDQVYTLTGGLAAWERENLPVEK